MKIIIVGGGQVAELVARRLIREGNEITIVEQREDRCRQLEDVLDAKVVQGNAASVVTLRKAGIRDAEMLLAITNSDADNILATLVAQVESDVRVKVIRIRTHEFEHWQQVVRKAGLKVDLFIHPETELAERIMRVVRVPGVSDILEFFDGRVKLFGMNVDINSWLAGKTLEELDKAGPPKNSLISMIFRGQQVIIPHGAETLRPGDHIYCITLSENLDATLRFLGVEQAEKLQRVFVIGGKQVGIQIAETLSKQGVRVKLFERDEQRCQKIAALLPDTIVIRADGTDQSALQESNIEDVDAFLALTNDDEDNILAALLARKFGVRKVIALINRLHYLPMVQRLGINATVSPRLAIVDRILRFVRKGSVLSVTSFREEEAEAIELIASPNSKYVGKRLRDLRLPRGAIVGAIARPNGDIVVPRGDEAIREGDRVVFFTLQRAIAELESSFVGATSN